MPIYKTNFADRWKERIPDVDESARRWDIYKILRRNHFTDYEATKICTALSKPDREGIRHLQPLDITTEGWQAAIKKQRDEYKDMVKSYVKKGFTRRQANRIVQNQIEMMYSERMGEDDSRSVPTAWDSIRDYYKAGNDTGKERPSARDSFFKNLRKREATLSQKG